MAVRAQILYLDLDAHRSFGPPKNQQTSVYD